MVPPFETGLDFPIADDWLRKDVVPLTRPKEAYTIYSVCSLYSVDELDYTLYRGLIEQEKLYLGRQLSAS